MQKTEIRLFFAGQGAPYESDGLSYTLEQFGGTVPAIGDSIVDPGVLSGQNRLRPENRRILEIRQRFFLPDSASGAARVSLVVEERSGRPEELNLLGS